VPLARVLIVSHIRLYRDGLAQIIERDGRFSVVGNAASGPEAGAGFSLREVDLILLDMGAPEALACARLFAQETPTATVIALGVPDSEDDVIQCAEAGVAAYVSREASLTELLAVLEDAVRGECRCSPKVAGGLLRRMAMLAAERGPAGCAPRLTAREREVVRLIDAGLSNKEIAQRLGIELATVKNHVHNLLAKLQVHRRGEAAARIRGPLSLKSWDRGPARDEATLNR